MGVGSIELFGYWTVGDGCGSDPKNEVNPLIGNDGAVALDGDEVSDLFCIGNGKVVIGLRLSGDLNALKLGYLELMFGAVAWLPVLSSLFVLILFVLLCSDDRLF